MNQKKLSLAVVILCCCTLFLSSCLKKDNTISVPAPVKGANANVDALLGIKTSADFNYTTTKKVTLDITILAPDNSPIKNALITILTKAVDLGGVVLFKAMTDQSGKISASVILPTSLTTVVVDPAYPGVIRNAAVTITNNSIFCTLGGQNGYSGNVLVNSPLSGKITVNNVHTAYKEVYTAPYSYMGTYDKEGKPDYFDPINVPISASFLSNIAQSLPETVNIAISHPNYLSSNAETNIHLTQDAIVSFTFIGEGAGYLNSVAYFTYPTDTPPTKTTDIDSLHFILPNASLANSGGELMPGNTVSLGEFKAGTSIGFAMVSNGWDAKKHEVGDGLYTIYSIASLNPEPDVNLKKHTVLLFDNPQKLFLVGFEDKRRDQGSDNDFNDVLFYIKTDPIAAVKTDSIPAIDVAPVNQPNYTNSFTGTVAFEDNWPNLGDYDLNDLVVGYKYLVTYNASNNAVAMKAQFILKASGATFRNGFGVEFPFSASLVNYATGSIVTNNNIVTLGTNGLETGQTNAVIIPFDDAFTAMNTNNGFINTFVGQPFLTRDTITINLNFKRPLYPLEFGAAPFNPFIIIDRTRGREAHLSGYLPTSKVDKRYFKTGVDNTSIAEGIYYKTATNLPWGLAFNTDFLYPTELTAINAAYPDFLNWANSNGTINLDWYSDPSKRVSDLIYHQ